MKDNRLNVAYSFSWRLPGADNAQVRTIIEQLRLKAIELGAEQVSDVVVLTGADAQAIRSGADHVVMFSAAVPNARSDPPTSIQRYGLALMKTSPDESFWSWNAVVRVSSFREISKLMVAAAKVGIDVRTTFAGMMMAYKLNPEGEIVTDQRYAYEDINWDDF